MGLRELPRYLRVDAAERVSNQLSLFDIRTRIYASYETWEDYRAGMFCADADEAVVAGARALLSDAERLRLAMAETIRAWPVASAVNLSNPSCNRRAWLGQAACCFTLQATATATKRAWWQLSDGRRADANAVADELVNAWTPHSAAA